MNILIPMAGAGSRFQQMGYTFPKPLIEVEGKPMIQQVVENLNFGDEHRHIFIVQKEHYDRFALNYLLPLIKPNCEIIQVDKVTEGAACTALLAKKFIDNDDRLLIANSDQVIDWMETPSPLYDRNIDGGVYVFNATHPKWSFVKVDATNKVVEVAEKKPISDIATTGIYFWRRGKDFVRCAEQMIEKNIRVNNEFYIAPVFNEIIAEDKLIGIEYVNKMWGIGTPEDLKTYLDR
jgi:dTDP-glucose pyrophosphorylase